MTIRYREQKGTRGPLVITDTCGLCGAVREWHFKHFASHVYSEHEWSDTGLPDPMEAGDE